MTDEPRFPSRNWEGNSMFSEESSQVWVPTMRLFDGYRKIFPGVKRSECESDEVKGKEEGSPHSICHSAHRDALMCWVHPEGRNHNPKTEVRGASEKVVTACVSLRHGKHVSVNTDHRQECIYGSTSGV
jgi:hypothetical protein